MRRHPPSLAVIAAAAGGGHNTATVGTAYTTKLAARVTDASAQPVAGATVTFSAPASGASGSFGAAGATVTAVSGSGRGRHRAAIHGQQHGRSFFGLRERRGRHARRPPFALDECRRTDTARRPCTLTPAADSYVESDLPSTNFGSSAVLKNNTSPDTRAYLKFDLTGISGNGHEGDVQGLHADVERLGLRAASASPTTAGSSPGSPTATDRPWARSSARR